MDVLNVSKLLWNPVVFGEVLFDIFPDGTKTLGGAPFNVAWHLQAFGLAPLFISAVGNDAQGNEILQRMQQWQMNTAGVLRHESLPTGTVEVHFHDNEPEYEIRSPCAWDDIGPDATKLPTRSLLYHGSLALRESANRESLALLRKHSGRCFVDINVRQPWWDEAIATAVLNGTEIIKLNIHELELITGQNAQYDSAAAARALIQHYKPEKLIITMGEKGVLYNDSSTRELLEIPVPKDASVVDTVGAGDAFSSVCMLGECLGWPGELTLQRALDFAAAIVGIRGATPDDRIFYQPFLDSWTET